MRPELDIYGIYLPTLAVLALGAYFANSVLQRRWRAPASIVLYGTDLCLMLPCTSAFSA